MYLTYRNARLSDLETCYPFVQARLGYPPSLQKPILDMWREMLDHEVGICFVIEDRDRTPKPAPVGIGFSFFGTDDFVRDAKTVLPPFLPERILEMRGKGACPYLDKEEAQRVHAEKGVNIVVTHWGVDPGYRGEDYLKVIQYMSQSYQEILKTYRMREFLEEVYGEFERNRLATFGLTCHRDYREFLGTRYLPQSMGPKHPFLMGVVLEQVRREEDKIETIAGKQALLGPPRFGFQAKEQEVLKRALLGVTDEEIAEELGLTCIAIKKRWQGIYEKVESVDPHLLDPEVEGKETPGKAKRKRRALMVLLKEHPEEFWPNPEKPRGKGRPSQK